MDYQEVIDMRKDREVTTYEAAVRGTIQEILPPNRHRISQEEPRQSTSAFTPDTPAYNLTQIKIETAVSPGSSTMYGILPLSMPALFW